MKYQLTQGIYAVFFISICLQSSLHGFAQGPSSNFVGAELTSNVTSPGKLKITLRTFYTAAQATVPETETVSVISGKPAAKPKTAELKKETEYIDVKYPFVAGKESTPPAVKQVTYSVTVDMGQLHASYDVAWTPLAIPAMLNNVELGNGDAVSLTVHIEDVMKVINNTPPMLEHLPAYKVSSTATTTGKIITRDNDGIDKVEVLLSAPMVSHASASGAADKGIAKGGKLTEVSYRKGYSAVKPFAAASTYNGETGEFSFERPAFGIYLCAITITDYRNREALSRHQAIFIISSFL